MQAAAHMFAAGAAHAPPAPRRRGPGPCGRRRQLMQLPGMHALAHLGHAHEAGHHAVHVGAAVRDRLLGARIAVVRLQHAVQRFELQRRLLLRQLRVQVGSVFCTWRASGGGFQQRPRCGAQTAPASACMHAARVQGKEPKLGRVPAQYTSCSAAGCTWKERHTTTGAPVAVLKRSLICALTSVSPATCTAASAEAGAQARHSTIPRLTVVCVCCEQAPPPSPPQTHPAPHLGVMDEGLAALGVGWQLAGARLLQALDDRLGRPGVDEWRGRGMQGLQSAACL